MTPQELKNSILQLAIQGRLVEQRPEEGTAEELYCQIQREKAALVKAGKIKKEKPLPEIAEEEVPFEIPEGWKWVRVRDCVSNRAGLAYKKENLLVKNNDMIRVLRGGNISDMGYALKEDDVFIAREYVKDDLLLKHNTIITPAVTSLDHVGKMGRIECDYSNVVVGGFVLMLNPHYDNDTFARYLLYAFSSKYFRDCCRQIVNKSGQAFYNLSREKMMALIIPLPPLAEQKRIVAKIEELLPYIDRYEKAWSRLEDFNKRFPTDMQKSILQLAIQGKLVPQRPEEGTGEALYQQIQAEKQSLIRSGKLKKEKPLPEITPDEIPFDIPESWKWVRLGKLVECITSGSRDWAKYYSDTGDIFIRMGNLSRNSFHMRLDKTQHVKAPENTEGQRTSLQEGDLLFSITAEIGMLGLIPADFGKAYINQHTAMIRFIELLRNRYIPYVLMTDYAQKYYNGNQHGIKNSFRLDRIATLPVPLPPLAEQKRIVARLEELLPLCDRLK